MTHRIIRGVALVAATVAVVGCSPAQRSAWLAWFELEPRAAVRWAADECDALCSDDWDGDGVVEPDGDGDAARSAASGNWTDVTTEDTIFDEPEPEPEAWGQCSEWMDDALAAGWTEEQWGTLNWIMAAESGCDPGATSSAGAQGLLQIMPMWADDCGGGSLYEPWFNLACGLHVYHEQGWTAWDVY